MFYLPDHQRPAQASYLFRYRKPEAKREYGCWVYLCAEHHNMSNEGVHFNKPFEIVLKKYCQEKWEDVENNGTREEFIHTFGKSYL